MTKDSKRAGILTTFFAAGAVALGIGAAPAASAAEGCGFGYHIAEGACVVNLPGPGARIDPADPGCWFNDNNERRCY